MRLRTFIIAAVVALAVSFTVGFHAPLRDGPIPCPDGSTVDFGQFCPLPTIQCSNGTAVPIGQFCPLAPTPAAKPAAPPQVSCPDGSTAPSTQQCPTTNQAPPPPAIPRSQADCPPGTTFDRAEPNNVGNHDICLVVPPAAPPAYNDPPTSPPPRLN